MYVRAGWVHALSPRPQLWVSVVWKWNLSCSFNRRNSSTVVDFLTFRPKLEAVICHIGTVKGFCALLLRRSTGLVCFTHEAAEAVAQASTRPHCCLSQRFHHLISAQGLAVKILTLCSLYFFSLTFLWCVLPVCAHHLVSCTHIPKKGLCGCKKG